MRIIEDERIGQYRSKQSALRHGKTFSTPHIAVETIAYRCEGDEIVQYKCWTLVIVGSRKIW